MSITAASPDSYYITCSYMSSKEDYYPNNKPEEFHLKFYRPLRLVGNWKVGLCDISFVNITHEAADTNVGIKYSVHFSDCEGLYKDGL